MAQRFSWHGTDDYQSGSQPNSVGSGAERGAEPPVDIVLVDSVGRPLVVWDWRRKIGFGADHGRFRGFSVE